MADLTGDRRADIVGFGDAGVWTALSNGDGSFTAPAFVVADFGSRSGIQHRVISLGYLQSKLDVFFNQRVRPLFQVKLDNPQQTFGTSTVKVAVDKNNGAGPVYDFDHPAFKKELTGLNFSVGFTYNFYFQNLNTDRITLNLVPGPVLGFEVRVHFETTGGIEIKVDGHTGHDIDLKGLDILLRAELTQRGRGWTSAAGSTRSTRRSRRLTWGSRDIVPGDDRHLPW